MLTIVTIIGGGIVYLAYRFGEPDATSLSPGQRRLTMICAESGAAAILIRVVAPRDGHRHAAGCVLYCWICCGPSLEPPANPVRFS